MAQTALTWGNALSTVYGSLGEGGPSMTFRQHRLAQRRKAVGHSQEQLAERLGVERSTVVRWERGETQPQPWLRPRIARALQISLSRLDELLAGGVDADFGGTERLDHVLQHPSSVDPDTAAHVREKVQRLGNRYDRAPSARLLAEAGRSLGHVAFLRRHAATDRMRRELYAVEAEAAILMGQLVWDASQRRDHATARIHYDQAISAARQLHDAATEGHALLRKSFVALYGEQNPCVGLNLAEQTAYTTRGVSRALTGLALLHGAEAQAMLGQKRSCEQALSAAESHLGQIDTADPAGGLFSPTQLGRLAGSCYLFLGNHQRAQSLLERTARALQDRKKSHAIVLGNLVLAYLRSGELEDAVVTLHQAIDVVELTRGGGGLNIVFSAGRELQPWRHLQPAHDVHDRLLTLMTAA